VEVRCGKGVSLGIFDWLWGYMEQCRGREGHVDFALAVPKGLVAHFRVGTVEGELR
jgi:hypothetical protein